MTDVSKRIDYIQKAICANHLEAPDYSLACEIADTYKSPSNASTLTSIIPNTLAHDSPCSVSSVAALQMVSSRHHLLGCRSDHAHIPFPQQSSLSFPSSHQHLEVADVAASRLGRVGPCRSFSSWNKCLMGSFSPVDSWSLYTPSDR